MNPSQTENHEPQIDTLEEVSETLKEQVAVLEEERAEAEATVSKMQDHFEDIAGQIESCRRSMELIKKLSTELELLGVNATIQAAHAGEQGKGFLIVAEYINKLSQNSKKSVDDVLHQLSFLTQSSEGAEHDFSEIVHAMENHRSLLDTLNDSMESASMDEACSTTTKE